MTRALSAAKIALDEPLQLQILTIIQDLEQGRMFRGRGGEMIRDAVCHLIESVAFSCFKLPPSFASPTSGRGAPFKAKAKVGGR